MRTLRNEGSTRNYKRWHNIQYWYDQSQKWEHEVLNIQHDRKQLTWKATPARAPWKFKLSKSFVETVTTRAALAHLDERRENDIPFMQSSDGLVLVRTTWNDIFNYFVKPRKIDTVLTSYNQQSKQKKMSYFLSYHNHMNSMYIASTRILGKALIPKMQHLMANVVMCISSLRWQSPRVMLS